MKITSEFELVTKTKADMWLQRNLSNRRVTQGVVSRYMNDLKKGEWAETGEPIILDEEGNLLDGQHRLLAIRNTGLSARINVVRGVKKSAFKYINTGKNRSAADVLSIDGVKNPTQMSSTITFIILWDGKRFSDAAHHSGRNKTFITNSIISDFANKHLKKLEESVKIGFDKENGIFTPSYLAGFHFIASRLSKESADDFCEKLIIGENLPRTNPIFKLRKRLLDDKNSLKRMSKIQRLGLLCKTWNLYRKNEEVDILRFEPSREEMPKLV